MTTQFAMPEEELAALVAEVAQGINEITKKEADKAAALRKSGGDEGSAGGDEGGGEGGGDSGGGDASAGGPPAGAPPAGDPSASAGAPPAGDPSASAGAPPAADPAAGAAPADDGAGAAPSVEDLEHLYAQLPDDQLQAHFVAIQQAVAQRSGGAGAGAPPDASGAPGGAPPMDPAAAAGAGAPPPGAAPAGPPAGAPPAPAGPPAGAPPAGPSASPEDPTMKSLKGEVADLKKNLEVALTALDKLTAGNPLRKSVTRVEGNIVYVPYQGGEVAVAGAAQPMKKSVKEMTKAEITARLNEVAKDSKLTKSDRELINGYYDRKVGIELLEKFFQ